MPKATIDCKSDVIVLMIIGVVLLYLWGHVSPLDVVGICRKAHRGYEEYKGE